MAAVYEPSGLSLRRLAAELERLGWRRVSVFGAPVVGKTSRWWLGPGRVWPSGGHLARLLRAEFPQPAGAEAQRQAGRADAYDFQNLVLAVEQSEEHRASFRAAEEVEQISAPRDGL